MRIFAAANAMCRALNFGLTCQKEPKACAESGEAFDLNFSINDINVQIMYTFTTFNFARLRQAEKGEYYQQVVDMVESSGLDGKIAPGQWTAFKTDTRHYFQLVSQYAASSRTVWMKRYDRARNAVFRTSVWG